MTITEAWERLEALRHEKVRALNRKNGAGDAQFGVRLGDVRKLANEIRPDHALATARWATGNVDTRLLAILLMKPKQLSSEELDPWAARAGWALTAGRVRSSHLGRRARR